MTFTAKDGKPSQPYRLRRHCPLVTKANSYKPSTPPIITYTVKTFNDHITIMAVHPSTDLVMLEDLQDRGTIDPSAKINKHQAYSNYFDKFQDHVNYFKLLVARKMLIRPVTAKTVHRIRTTETYSSHSTATALAHSIERIRLMLRVMKTTLGMTKLSIRYTKMYTIKTINGIHRRNLWMRRSLRIIKKLIKVIPLRAILSPLQRH